MLLLTYCTTLVAAATAAVRSALPQEYINGARERSRNFTVSLDFPNCLRPGGEALNFSLFLRADRARANLGGDSFSDQGRLVEIPLTARCLGARECWTPCAIEDVPEKQAVLKQTTAEGTLSPTWVSTSRFPNGEDDGDPDSATRLPRLVPESEKFGFEWYRLVNNGSTGPLGNGSLPSGRRRMMQRRRMMGVETGPEIGLEIGLEGSETTAELGTRTGSGPGTRTEAGPVTGAGAGMGPGMGPGVGMERRRRRRRLQDDPEPISLVYMYGLSTYMNLQRPGGGRWTEDPTALETGRGLAGGYLPSGARCDRNTRINMELARFVTTSLTELGFKGREPRKFGAFDYELTTLWSRLMPYDRRVTCASYQAEAYARAVLEGRDLPALPAVRGRPKEITQPGAPEFTDADTVLPASASGNPAVFYRWLEANGLAPTIVYSLSADVGSGREVLLGLVNNSINDIEAGARSGHDDEDVRSLNKLRNQVVAATDSAELQRIAEAIGLENFVNQFLLQRRAKNSLARQGSVDTWQADCPCSRGVPPGLFSEHAFWCGAESPTARVSDSRCDFTPRNLSMPPGEQFSAGDAASCQPRFVARDPGLRARWATPECAAVNTREKLCDLAAFRAGCGQDAPYALYNSLVAMYDVNGEPSVATAPHLPALGSDGERDAAVLEALCAGGRPRTDLWFETGGEPGDGVWDEGLECPCSESSSLVYRVCPTNPWDRMDLETGAWLSTGTLQRGRLERGSCICAPMFEPTVLRREIQVVEQIEDRCNSPALFSGDKFEDRQWRTILDTMDSLGATCCLPGEKRDLCNDPNGDGGQRAAFLLLLLRLTGQSRILECCLGEGCAEAEGTSFFEVSTDLVDVTPRLKPKKLDEKILGPIARAFKAQYKRTDRDRCAAQYTRTSSENELGKLTVAEQGAYNLALADNVEALLGNFINKVVPAWWNQARHMQALLNNADALTQVSDILTKISELGLSEAEGDFDTVRAGVEDGALFLQSLNGTISDQYAALARQVSRARENVDIFALSSAAEANFTRAFISVMEDNLAQVDALLRQAALIHASLDRDAQAALGDHARRSSNVPKTREHVVNTLELMLYAKQSRGLAAWVSHMPADRGPGGGACEDLECTPQERAENWRAGRSDAQLGVFPATLPLEERRFPVSVTRLWFVAQGEADNAFSAPGGGGGPDGTALWLHQVAMELVCEVEWLVAGLQHARVTAAVLSQVFGPPECLLGSTRPGRKCTSGCRMRAFHRACVPGSLLRDAAAARNEEGAGANTVRGLEQALLNLVDDPDRSGWLSQELGDLAPYTLCEPGTMLLGLASDALGGDANNTLLSAASSSARPSADGSQFNAGDLLAGVRAEGAGPLPLPPLRNYSAWAQRVGDFLVDLDEPGLDSASHDTAVGWARALCARGLGAWLDSTPLVTPPPPPLLSAQSALSDDISPGGLVWDELAFANMTARILVVDQRGYDASEANLSTTATQGYVHAALAVIQEGLDLVRAANDNNSLASLPGGLIPATFLLDAGTVAPIVQRTMRQSACRGDLAGTSLYVGNLSETLLPRLAAAQIVLGSLRGLPPAVPTTLTPAVAGPTAGKPGGLGLVYLLDLVWSVNLNQAVVSRLLQELAYATLGLFPPLGTNTRYVEHTVPPVQRSQQRRDERQGEGVGVGGGGGGRGALALPEDQTLNPITQAQANERNQHVDDSQASSLFSTQSPQERAYQGPGGAEFRTLHRAFESTMAAVGQDSAPLIRWCRARCPPRTGPGAGTDSLSSNANSTGGGGGADVNSSAVHVTVELNLARLSELLNETEAALRYQLVASGNNSNSNNSSSCTLAAPSCARLAAYSARLRARNYLRDVALVQSDDLVRNEDTLWTLGHLHCAEGRGCALPQVWQTANAGNVSGVGDDGLTLYTYNLGRPRVGLQRLPTHKGRHVNTISLRRDLEGGLEAWLRLERDGEKAPMFEFDAWYSQFGSLSSDQPAVPEQLYDPRDAAFDAETLRVPLRRVVFTNPQSGHSFASLRCAVPDRDLRDWCQMLAVRRVVLRAPELDALYAQEGPPASAAEIGAAAARYGRWLSTYEATTGGGTAPAPVMELELWTEGLVSAVLDMPEFDFVQTLWLADPCPTDFRALYTATPFISIRFTDSARAVGETLLLRFTASWRCSRGADSPLDVAGAGGGGGGGTIPPGELRTTQQLLVLDDALTASGTGAQSGALSFPDDEGGNGTKRQILYRLYPPTTDNSSAEDSLLNLTFPPDPPLVCQALSLRADRVAFPDGVDPQDMSSEQELDPQNPALLAALDSQDSALCWQLASDPRLERSVPAVSETLVAYKEVAQTLDADLFNITRELREVQRTLQRGVPNALLGHPYLAQVVSNHTRPTFALVPDLDPQDVVRTGTPTNVSVDAPLQAANDTGAGVAENWNAGTAENSTLPPTSDAPIEDLYVSLLNDSLLRPPLVPGVGGPETPPNIGAWPLTVDPSYVPGANDTIGEPPVDPLTFDLTFRRELDNWTRNISNLTAFNLAQQDLLANLTASTAATAAAVNQTLNTTPDRLLQGFVDAAHWRCFADLIMNLSTDELDPRVEELVYGPLREAAAAAERVRRNERAAKNASWMFIITLLPLAVLVPVLVHLARPTQYLTWKAVADAIAKDSATRGAKQAARKARRAEKRTGATQTGAAQTGATQTSASAKGSAPTGGSLSGRTAIREGGPSPSRSLSLQTAAQQRDELRPLLGRR